MKVTLINGVTAGLMNMSRAFAKTHGDAQKLQRTINEIKFLALGGGVLAGSGLFGLHLIGKTMPFAREYARQLALMNTLGMKQAEIAKVVGDAWRTTYAVPTTTAAQNLASFRELRSAFGSDTLGQAHASEMLPVVARLQGVMQSLTGRAQDHIGFDMVKAIELRTGVMTTEALQRNSELMSRAIIGMGGTISVSDFHGALKMGKIATNKLSDDFTYNYLPTLMQELKTSGGGGTRGAQSAGTILMSLYQQMHGRMTKAAMPLWVQAGLIRPEDVVKNATGQFQIKPGAVAGTALFEQNPFLWVQKYLAPAVDRLAASRHISPETAINAMFSNRNAAFGAYNMYFKAAQYERDKTTITKADGGFAAYQKLLRTDPTLASQALHSQWQNILAQIGFSIMPTLVRGTLLLVGALKDLGGVMHRHPTAVKVLTLAFAGLSTVLLFSGTVLLITAAFKAMGLALGVFRVAALVPLVAEVLVAAAPFLPLIAAITAVSVAVHEAFKHWDSTKGVLWNIAHELGLFFTWLINMGRKLAGLPALAPDGTPGGIPKKKSFGDILGDALSPGSSALASGSRFVKTAPAAKPVQITTNLMLDGKKIAQAVSTVQAREMANSASRGWADPSATLPSAAAGYAR